MALRFVGSNDGSSEFRESPTHLYCPPGTTIFRITIVAGRRPVRVDALGGSAGTAKPHVEAHVCSSTREL